MRVRLNTTELAKALPQDLRDARAFVLWKYEDERKVPYYAHGGRRHGEQGCPQDRKHLVTFDEAVAAYKGGGFDGMGLALLPDLEMVALDFDDCRSPDGKLPERVQGFVNASYAEVSPSGTGVRVLMRGSLPDSKNAGVQVFSTKGYVTLTGNRLNGAKVAALTSDIRAHLQALTKPKLHVDFSNVKRPLDRKRILAGVPEGERDWDLYRLACSYRARGLSEPEVKRLVLDAAAKCKPPFPHKEAMKKVREAFKKPSRYDDGDDDELVLTRASTIPMQLTRWVWPDYVACGVINLLAGEGGLGKSQITVAIAAALSAGGPFPDGKRARQGNVVILSAEDDIARTLVPRLRAAGADTDRVHVVEGMVNRQSMKTRLFSFEKDLEKLKAAVRKIGNVAMVSIDPVTAYLGTKIDSHQTSHVRSWLAPLAAFAQEMEIALLLVAHFKKPGDAKRAVDLISGSAAWSQAARRVLYAVWDVHADVGYFLRGKTNLSPHTSGGFEYTLVDSIAFDGNTKVPTSHVKWGQAVDIRADDVLSAGVGKTINEAKAWLAKRLAGGPVASTVIEEECPDDVSLRTLKRAKTDLHIVSKKQGGHWVWMLPKT